MGVRRFFHNCYMGNMESLTQIRGIADHIVASSHVLSSNGEPLTEFVRGVVDNGNAEDAAGQMFDRIESIWPAQYSEDGKINNGDYKMIRTDKLDAIIDASKRLCERIMALYPTRQDAIDRATRQNRRLTVAREVFKKEFGMLPSELTKGNKNEH